MKNYSAKDVDSYIASSGREARPKLKEIRKIINSTIPKVEGGISWGVPFYKYHGVLAGFAAYKNHVSFGPVWLAALQSNYLKRIVFIYLLVYYYWYGIGKSLRIQM